MLVHELLDAALHRLSLLSTIVTKGLCLGLGLENGFWALGERVNGDGMLTASGALVVYEENADPRAGKKENVDTGALTAPAGVLLVPDEATSAKAGTGTAIWSGAANEESPAELPKFKEVIGGAAAAVIEPEDATKGGTVAVTATKGLVLAYVPKPKEGTVADASVSNPVTSAAEAP